jgi:GMP synthase (glutamine-hydrolysing)
MLSSVIVLDFGSQYTQLIARRIRELNIHSEIRPCTIALSEVDMSDVKAVILSGSPASVTDANAPKFDKAWLETGLPTLGVCYGMQLMSHLGGGALGSGARREYGAAMLEIVKSSPLFQGFDLNEQTLVWMSHGDHVETPPPGFEIIASSEGLPCAAIANEATKQYGLQFHPEVVHSARGMEIIANFVSKIAGIPSNWTPRSFLEDTISKIQAEVSKEANVICGLSGGVDSTIAAVVVDKAIHNNLICIFVDNGLLRKHEAQEVVRSLGKEGLGLTLIHVDASERFLTQLKGVTDPEQKRKIIGRVFIEVFEEESEKIPNVTHLVQGTLYPDVIESVSVHGPSVVIKTHHNVGGLPERMKLKLIEPFRELFKDEVRRLGTELQVPRALVQRQPFPGPGLAVRILGEVTKEKLALLKDADAIFMEEIRSAGLYETLWQSFVVLLPVQSVGVMGDLRTYEQAVALRAVTSEDGMTADWAYLPQELLARTSNRIINEVRGINRVVLDISSKPPATIEWE